MDSAIDTNSRSRLQFLDSLRALAIIMVVGVHALGYGAPVSVEQRQFILALVQTVAVPVFFLVDGFLFSRSVASLKPYHAWQAVKNNSLRLLLPWLIFSALYLLLRYIFELNGMLADRLVIGKTTAEVTLNVYASVYAPQMYFLLSLFIIRLFCPLIRRLLLCAGLNLLLLLFFLFVSAYHLGLADWLSRLAVEGGQEPVIHAVWGFQYYLAGIVLFRLTERFNLKNAGIPALVLLASIFYIYLGSGLIDFVVFQFVYLFCLFAVFYTFEGALSFLVSTGRNTMGIYLVHAPVLLKLVAVLINSLTDQPLYGFIGIWLVSFLVSFAVVKVIRYLSLDALLFGEVNIHNRGNG